ncbi:DUF4440 domain-containing protein [Pseudonocardia nigra]|uniref:DUF4440 domain-containing protein n=1 Tax=Pseudonocardia nigra TaxID=1921578 RepID=UPI001C5D961A|nr:DUF4440 domain-containing protein [Pseudonocardia nigra]
MDESAEALCERCAAQVDQLHRTIAAWLTGSAPRTPAVFAAFADAHAEQFTMVTPDGALLRRDELFRGFEGAHGSAPGLTIRIADVDVDVVRADRECVVATYEEWQNGAGAPSGRRSTALLDRDPAAPHGLRSRHLHETWISRG